MKGRKEGRKEGKGRKKGKKGKKEGKTSLKYPPVHRCTDGKGFLLGSQMVESTKYGVLGHN